MPLIYFHEVHCNKENLIFYFSSSYGFKLLAKPEAHFAHLFIWSSSCHLPLWIGYVSGTSFAPRTMFKETQASQVCHNYCVCWQFLTRRVINIQVSNIYTVLLSNSEVSNNSSLLLIISEFCLPPYLCY